MSQPVDNLHDAILLGIQLDWGTGLATVTLRTWDAGKVDILVRDCTSVVLPRQGPWGRSSSVSSVSFVNNDSTKGLTIAMQSGDTLEIHGHTADPTSAKPG